MSFRWRTAALGYKTKNNIGWLQMENFSGERLNNYRGYFQMANGCRFFTLNDSGELQMEN